jgi:two-component system, sensor histidine kinase
MSAAISMPAQLARSALESAPDAIVVSDASGAVMFVNRQVATLFGYASEEILGRPVEDLLPERYRDLHRAHRADFAHGPRWRPMGAGLELHGLHKDGSEFPVEISLSPIEDGERLLVAAAIRDVTDRKRIHGELVTARETAERANLAKSRFLATASHDIRQPLQTLALLNGALRRITRDAALEDVLMQQDQAIGSMLRLVNALLDISKLEAGVVKPKIVDFTITSAFEELRREFAFVAAEKGLELNVEPCADTVRSDPALVAQILRNLLSNAIKYTRQGMVSLRCLHLPAAVQIEILDTGIGISAEDLPYIFDEFYQVANSPHALREGYGLGLNIVNRLSRLLDLSLDVRSQPGRGSSFLLQLPVVATRAAAPGFAAPSVPKPPRSRLRHVLLVEDHGGVRDAMRMLLGTEGYAVVVASSAEEALRIAESDARRFELVIADYHLGAGRSGLEIIRDLRARCGAALKCILMSGDTSTAVKGLQADEGLRLVSKPLRAERLLALIRELLADRDAPAP